MHLHSLLQLSVWFCEPQTKRPDETPDQFAIRVKHVIAQQSGIIPTPWDGYLKYFRPNKREVEARQRLYAELLRCRFPSEPTAEEPPVQHVENLIRRRNLSGKNLAAMS
jgi:hypothetical protein